jgi:peptidoglycan/xylan/chitin deacetylase (PgdA/CDA1 family)
MGFVCVVPLCVRAQDFLGPFVYSDADSLPAIAQCWGMSAAQLLSLNNLSWKALQEGQALRLPDGPPHCPDPAHVPRFFSAQQQMQREIWRGIRGRRQIALTFDAGGELGSAPRLLEVLEADRIPATFFVTGQFARKNPDWVRQAAASGAPLYNHSWSHPWFTRLDEAQMREELERTDALLRDLTGRPTRPYWRPPYGDRNRRVLATAAQAGFRSIYWTVDSLDSYGEPRTPEFLIRRVTGAHSKAEDSDSFLDGAIVLMHVNVAATAEAVGEIAAALRARGFTLVTLPDLLAPAAAGAASTSACTRPAEGD